MHRGRLRPERAGPAPRGPEDEAARVTRQLRAQEPGAPPEKVVFVVD